jgi:hypothetical protein
MGARALTTWRKELTRSLIDNEENWLNVVETTLSDIDLDAEFDPGYGGENGCAFTLWTVDFVYFPVCYDGLEWVGSAPRYPCSNATKHQGGGG